MTAILIIKTNAKRQFKIVFANDDAAQNLTLNNKITALLEIENFNNRQSFYQEISLSILIKQGSVRPITLEKVSQYKINSHPEANYDNSYYCLIYPVQKESQPLSDKKEVLHSLQNKITGITHGLELLQLPHIKNKDDLVTELQQSVQALQQLIEKLKENSINDNETC